MLAHPLLCSPTSAGVRLALAGGSTLPLRAQQVVELVEEGRGDLQLHGFVSRGRRVVMEKRNVVLSLRSGTLGVVTVRGLVGIVCDGSAQQLLQDHPDMLLTASGGVYFPPEHFHDLHSLPEAWLSVLRGPEQARELPRTASQLVLDMSSRRATLRRADSRLQRMRLEAQLRRAGSLSGPMSMVRKWRDRALLQRRDSMQAADQAARLMGGADVRARFRACCCTMLVRHSRSAILAARRLRADVRLCAWACCAQLDGVPTSHPDAAAWRDQLLDLFATCAAEEDEEAALCMQLQDCLSDRATRGVSQSTDRLEPAMLREVAGALPADAQGRVTLQQFVAACADWLREVRGRRRKGCLLRPH